MPERPALTRWRTVDATGKVRGVRLTASALWRVLPLGSRLLLVLGVIVLGAALVVPLFTEEVIVPTAASTSGAHWFRLLFPVFMAAQFLVQIALMLSRDGAGDRIAADHLRHQRCPSCRYDLRDSPAAEDGAITCPECGAVWRLSTPPPHPAQTDSGKGG